MRTFITNALSSTSLSFGQDNRIAEIRIVTEKVLNVYSALQNAYGKPADVQGTKLTWWAGKIECSIEDDNTQIPGYHIRYKSISQVRIQLNELREKATREGKQNYRNIPLTQFRIFFTGNYYSLGELHSGRAF